ncbi:hypothetical protein DFH09DRAFT_1322872 [Mycena vulgaris]|nr:hypothetical protein DFH09DRAFT_1322872 [Mycena vulgaris]
MASPHVFFIGGSVVASSMFSSTTSRNNGQNFLEVTFRSHAGSGPARRSPRSRGEHSCIGGAAVDFGDHNRAAHLRVLEQGAQRPTGSTIVIVSSCMMSTAPRRADP